MSLSFLPYLTKKQKWNGTNNPFQLCKNPHNWRTLSRQRFNVTSINCTTWRIGPMWKDTLGTAVMLTTMSQSGENQFQLGWVERILIWYCSGTVAKTEATNLTGATRHSQQHWPSSVWLVFELFKRCVQEITIRLMEHGAGADYRSAHVRNFWKCDV